MSDTEPDHKPGRARDFERFVTFIDAIVAMWGQPESADPQHDLHVLIENPELGIITGTIVYPGGESYANLWEAHLAPDGRAHRFVEWYMTPPKPDED